MKPTTIYLVITSVDGLGNGHEAFRDEAKAIAAAHRSVKMFSGRKLVTETDLPRKDPICVLHLTWGTDNDSSVTVLEVNLS